MLRRMMRMVNNTWFHQMLGARLKNCECLISVGKILDARNFGAQCGLDLINSWLIQLIFSHTLHLVAAIASPSSCIRVNNVFKLHQIYFLMKLFLEISSVSPCHRGALWLFGSNFNFNSPKRNANKASSLSVKNLMISRCSSSSYHRIMRIYHHEVWEEWWSGW